MVSLTTYGGWAGVLAVAGGYWYLLNRRGRNSQKIRSTIAHTSKGSEPRKTVGKAKKGGNDATQSGADHGNTSQEGGKNNKRKQKAKSSAEADAIQSSRADVGSGDTIDDNNDDEMDNREFARQLQSAKSGTVLGSKPQASSRQKSVKQSKAASSPEAISEKVNHGGPISNTSTASSTAGMDADDDLSAANSPNFGATKANGSIDVSDMLESQAAGPSVLRITESNNPASSRKQKKDAAPVATETKKQRQNRKKAEEKKAVREEDEKERRVLMEKQRRAAREAEGRAAKDGSSFMAATAPASSAWTAPIANTNDNTENAISKVEMLDTYDSTVSKPTNVTESAVADAAKPNGKWAGELPSEEEQMRLLREENEWATVGSKKSKKNTASRQPDKPLADKPVTNGTNINGSSDQTHEVQVPEHNVSFPAKKENRKVHEVELEYNVGNTKVSETQYLQDSEWDV